LCVFSAFYGLRESLGVTEKANIRLLWQADFGFITAFAGVLSKKQGLSIRIVLSLAEV